MVSRKTLVVAAIVVLLGICAAVVAEEAAPRIQVTGYMQNRVYIPEGSTLQFRAERLALCAKANLPNDSIAYAELQYHPSLSNNAVLVDSTYYETPVGMGRLRVGKGRNFTFGLTPTLGNRKTSNYSPGAESFTQDRIQGAQYLVQKESLDFGVSIHQSLRLGSRPIGDVQAESARAADHTVKHLALRDTQNDMSQRLAVSARIVGKWNDGRIKGGVSGLFGSIDDRDLVNLTTSSATNPLTPGGTPSLLPASTTSKTRRLLGADLQLKCPSGLLAQGEYYDAKISELGSDAWNVLLGYESADSWKFYARYSRQTFDVAKTANQLSWDLKQITLSAVQPIRKGMWVQYEYEINKEDSDTGIGVKNNIGFVELFVSF